MFICAKYEIQSDILGSLAATYIVVASNWPCMDPRCVGKTWLWIVSLACSTSGIVSTEFIRCVVVCVTCSAGYGA